MKQPVIHDMLFLGQKSTPATKEDLPIAMDLLDTLQAHAKICVGMAANMIGKTKRIIVVDDNGKYLVMLNPEICKATGEYDTEEGCLSLTGTRKTKRFRSIKVRYQNMDFQTRIKTFTDFTAQTIQHEIDHCNGIII